jgi:surface polysaccharide O-acyltransferase-like enzyme
MVWIDNARILAILGVVLLHVSGDAVTGLYSMGSYGWWVGNLYDSLVRWCVPVFVMLSGALLLDPAKQETNQAFYRKRVSRILIPLLFWSVFFIGWSMAKNVIKGESVSPYQVIGQLLSGRPYFHMWFLFMIMGLYLFTPVLRKVIAHSSTAEILFFDVTLFVLALINYAFNKLYANNTQLFINWFLFYLPYFIAGHVIRQTTIQPPRVMLVAVFCLTVVLTAFGCFWFAPQGGLDSSPYFYGYTSITVVPMSISIMFLLKENNTPLISRRVTSELVLLVMGVYLIHPIYIDALRLAGVTVRAYDPAWSVPLIAALAFLFSLATARLIQAIPVLRRVI